ncbi:lytic transglycosylase domain-containing protein [Microvirga sp. GCM10011540]|uniref:lytic transglycosylase domain-containing protein n=1 Tax=Microvirga sp. GCM10011540 TaxID=3317338 RepID=UPI00362186E2
MGRLPHIAACLAAVVVAAAQPAFASLHRSDARAEDDRISKIILSLPKPPVVETLVGLPPAHPRGRGHYLPLVAREAERRGLPMAVADAVVMVESAYDPSVTGTVGELGLMQVRPGTAAMLGFVGSREALADPATNIRYGVEYLAQAWRLAGGDLCRTLMKYRAGHGEDRMTPRSVEYCRRARLHLAAIGSPLAQDGTAVATGPSAPVQIASARPDQLTRIPQVTAEDRRRAALQRELARRFVLAVTRVGSQARGELLRPEPSTGRR